MPRNVRLRPDSGGRAASPIRRRRSREVRDAAIDAHIPFIEEAGKRGVQILGLQEVFNGPYFCPSQDAHWYDLAEPVPGPTTEADGRPTRRKYQMAMVVPVYEREQAGVYYNTAAVIDADGTLPRASTARTTSRTPVGLLGEVLLQAGQPRLPGVQDALRDDRRLHLLRPPLPRRRAAAGPERRRDRLQPVGHGRRLSQYLWKLEQPAHAVANGYFMACSNRVGTEAPWNIGRFYGSSYFVDPRGNFLADGVRGPGRARSSAELDLDMIEEVRRVWQFYRDRRPETYTPMAELLP